MADVPRLERDKMILDLLPMVDHHARQLTDRLPLGVVEFEELKSEGALALVSRAERWDPKRDCSLANYARRRIDGAMLDYVRQADSCTRYERLKAKAGADAPQRRVYQLSAPARNVSLERFAQPRTYEDVIPEKAERSPEILASRNEMQRVLTTALSSVSERNRQIVLSYYAGDGTMLELSRRFHINGPRICQIISAARKKMKAALKERGITSIQDFKLAA
jgi:RNA polymerase sigma factor for flagellar operon FliA